MGGSEGEVPVGWGSRRDMSFVVSSATKGATSSV